MGHILLTRFSSCWSRFIIADPFWNLAMAINVYLTFFCKYDASHLRKLEINYVLFAYGLNLIPAVVYLFVKTESRGPIYGSSTVGFLGRSFIYSDQYTNNSKAMVLDFRRLGLSPHRCFLRADLGMHPSYHWHLHPRWKRDSRPAP
jgi:hypothetical protein